MQKAKIVNKFISPTGIVFKHCQRVEWFTRYRGKDNRHTGTVAEIWSDGWIYVLDDDRKFSDNCKPWFRLKMI